jgi:hypothetical protein
MTTYGVRVAVVRPDVDDPDDVRVAQIDQRADLQIEPRQEVRPEPIRVVR